MPKKARIQPPIPTMVVSLNRQFATKCQGNESEKAEIKKHWTAYIMSRERSLIILFRKYDAATLTSEIQIVTIFWQSFR